ncbi:MAG: hypothetical protein QGI11_13940, partial [Nitrospinota bacterium]|nr:hypothetical protein [Nitrospinota bacterium]
PDWAVTPKEYRKYSHPAWTGFEGEDQDEIIFVVASVHYELPICNPQDAGKTEALKNIFVYDFSISGRRFLSSGVACS